MPLDVVPPCGPRLFIAEAGTMGRGRWKWLFEVIPVHDEWSAGGGKWRQRSSIIRRTCATMYSFPAHAPASSGICRLRTCACVLTVHVLQHFSSQLQHFSSQLQHFSSQLQQLTQCDSQPDLPPHKTINFNNLRNALLHRMSVMYTLSLKYCIFHINNN